MLLTEKNNISDKISNHSETTNIVIKKPKKVQRICVTGNIAGGKSTIIDLFKQLGFQIFQQKLTQEILDELKIFYGENMKNSYRIEKLFMKMYAELWKEAQKYDKIVIEDMIGCFDIFTQNEYEHDSLTEEQYEELREYFKNNLPSASDFDHVIYLRTDNPEINLARAQKRDRGQESMLTLDYLKNISNRFEKFINEMDNEYNHILMINNTHISPKETLKIIVKQCELQLTLYQQLWLGIKKFKKENMLVDINGSIASGKSSFIDKLLEIGFNIYPEDLTPRLLDLLDHFYNGETELAYTIEREFLASHISQWSKRNGLVVFESMSSPQAFIELYFEKKYMSRVQRDHLLYDYEMAGIPDAKAFDYCIYLDADENVLLNRISLRSRASEHKIDIEYLKSLKKNYEIHNSKNADKIITINTTNLTLDEVIEQFLKYVEKNGDLI